MTIFVADVGGTNSRLALAGDGGEIIASKRYENDDFSSFEAIVSTFFKDRGRCEISRACVAVAGPVTSRTARLTNRDWSFSVPDIATVLPAGAVGGLTLVNDLVALGHALPGLRRDQLADIREPDAESPGNGQSLVVGLGTGMNVCLIKAHPGGMSVFEAELGHASLPSSVQAALSAQTGDSAGKFVSIEQLFSGRGLSRLYAALTDQPGPAAHRIVAAPDGASGRTVETAAHLLGVLTRELVFQYLPLGGVYFAGGVARGVLAGAKPAFLGAFDAPGPFAELVGQVPVRLITDDAAALSGAAVLARRAVA